MAQMNRLHPSAAVAGLLVPQVQEVPFKKYLGSETNYGTMGKDAIYITSVTNINSETSVGQQWGSNLAKQSYTLGQVSAPYYRIEAYVEWDAQEQAKFEELSNGVALPDFLENLAKQGINQRRHEAILHGFDGATGLNQGILANATTSNLPADSKSKQTITAYDPAELQAFLVGVVRSAMDASYGMLKPVVIASSSRIVNYIQSAIVPLMNSQMPGAGVDTIGGLVGRVTNLLGAGPVEFIADNTLEASDSTGSDKIVFIAPGLSEQDAQGSDSKNLVGKFNSIRFNTWADKAEGIMRWEGSPALGVFGAKYTFKTTPGMTLRSEAVRVVTAKYA